MTLILKIKMFQFKSNGWSFQEIQKERQVAVIHGSGIGMYSSRLFSMHNFMSVFRHL